jgi:hypothetical protein
MNWCRRPSNAVVPSAAMSILGEAGVALAGGR